MNLLTVNRPKRREGRDRRGRDRSERGQGSGCREQPRIEATFSQRTCLCESPRLCKQQKLARNAS